MREMLAIGIVASMGCGATLTPEVPEEVTETSAALMVQSGAQSWTTNSRVVPVCWMQAGEQPAGSPSPRDWTPERTLIANHVARTWARVANIQFSWTATCPTTGTQSFVRASLLGKTVNDEWGWDGGSSRGNGAGLLRPPVAFNPSNPTLGDSVNFVFRADGLGESSPARMGFLAVHEFGHVIGFGHEQDRTDNNGACTDGVNADPGAQLLTSYDQNSVMNYCGPRLAKLTASDVIGARKFYGYRNAGDFNGDTQRDVLWRNVNTGVVKYWGMNGTAASSFPADMTGTIPLEWRVAGTGDFNNDGETDLVWQNSTNGESKLWFLNAGVPSGFPAPFAAGTGSEWMIRGVGDVDADGHPDIVWQSITTGTAKVWMMKDGLPVAFPSPFAANIDLNWKIVGMGDFNGDQKDDVVWQNRTNGQSKVWFMDGGTSVGWPAPFAGGVPSEWVLRAVGDYSGDNFPDVVWTNTATGESKVWVLGSASTATGFPGAFAGNVPSEWEIVGP